MIKPVSLWNFIHECDLSDAEYIGRVCIALTGKEVEFTRAERIQYAMIAKDNADMDERISVKKAADRERKRAWREKESEKERGRTRTDADIVGQTVKDAEGADSASSSIHPSVRPSVRPEDNNVSVSIPRARKSNLPTESQVVSVAKSAMMVPEHYARWWYREMVGRGWANTDGSTVDGSNWRPTLKAWYKRATPAELAEAKDLVEKTPKSRTTKAEDWTLCIERCANANQDPRTGTCRCSRGCIVPPNLLPNPQPPEQCTGFKTIQQ